MAVTARKYNPGFLSTDDLVAIFCVRTTEYESLIEMRRECSGSANRHQIVIGPRGSGKTSLLLRVAAETMRDAALAEARYVAQIAHLGPAVAREEVRRGEKESDSVQRHLAPASPGNPGRGDARVWHTSPRDAAFEIPQDA